MVVPRSLEGTEMAKKGQKVSKKRLEEIKTFTEIARSQAALLSKRIKGELSAAQKRLKKVIDDNPEASEAEILQIWDKIVRYFFNEKYLEMLDRERKH